MLPNGADVGYGNNHAGTVQYKNNWYVFYHDRRLRDTQNPQPSGERRSVSVDKLEYNTDGTIKKATLTTAGPAQIKNLNPYDTILATTINRQSGTIKTAICSAPNPGTITNDNVGTSAGTAGDRCVMLTSIKDGSWVRLKGVDFGTAGAAKFVVRAASAATGGSIEIRTGSNTGTLAGTCTIGATGGIATWKDIECNVSALTGVKDYLYLVFKGSAQFRISKYIFKTSGSTPSSSSQPSSSSSSDPQTCGEYQVSFCGGLAYSSVPSNSTTMPATGECLYIGDFEVIQPFLNSTVAINGVENTCGDTWEGGCGYNERPAKKDGGYYVYVKAGTINDYENNGWKGIVAKAKSCPTCGLGSSDYEAGSSIPPPTVSCAENASASSAKFNITGANDGGTLTSELNWNNAPPASHSFWNAGDGRVVRMYQVSCGGNVLNYGTAAEKNGIVCGTINIIPENATPIANQLPLATTLSPTYYSLKGEPLGSAKPQKPGVYIAKEGYSIKKIVVR
jgi:hypothetical protein